MYDYNYDYYNENELYHYGVPGMKWGVRRAGMNPAVSASRQRMMSAKANYKAAKKGYNKAFNSAYGYSRRHWIGSNVKRSKHYGESNRRFVEAMNAANKQNAAKSKYKQAKKDYKAEKKAARNTPEAIARRKKAAKVGAAVAATGLAAYGAYKINKGVKNKHFELAEQRALDSAFKQERDAWNRINQSKGPHDSKLYDRASDYAQSVYKRKVNQALNDNFATAAKDVYQDYRKRRSYLR